MWERSVAERADEHWRDAESGKPENHMLEHLEARHGGHGPPNFNFRVVKSCKSSKRGSENTYEGRCFKQERNVQ